MRAVAYRMLGSVSEADDAVQEAWLRLSRADTTSVENLGGWLTRVAAGLPRHAPLTEIATGGVAGRAGTGATGYSRRYRSIPNRKRCWPTQSAQRLLVVLEMLEPAERLAFILHDMFAVPFDEIAPIVGRTLRPRRSLRQPRSSPCARSRPAGK